jgi:hypothetical protein
MAAPSTLLLSERMRLIKAKAQAVTAYMDQYVNLHAVFRLVSLAARGREPYKRPEWLFLNCK